jgi:hypothetical protein
MGDDMELTFAQVEAEVRRIIGEDPEHVYRQGESSQNGTTCYYSDRTPGAVERCIFGAALHNLGVDDDILMGNEGEPIQNILGFNLDVSFTNRQSIWMSSLQSDQDESTSWGEALTEADHAHPLT